ncbi:MAG: acyltransferase [Verrucomicrobiales bacterium]
MAKSLLRRCVNRILNLVARISPGAFTLRPFLHRLRGVKIGPRVFIGDEVFIDGEFPELVEIHYGAAISMRAMIIAHNKSVGRVVIEKEAFIGPQAVILCTSGKEVRIGEGAVIGANCVISRSVPPRQLVMPAPTQVVAEATVPLASAGSIEEFWAGLRPVGGQATGRSSPAPSSSTGPPAAPDEALPVTPLPHDH